MIPGAISSLDVYSSLARDGVHVVDGLLESAWLDEVAELTDRVLSSSAARAGVRRVLSREPRLAALLDASPVNQLIAETAGEGARVIRAVLFDKSERTNWAVPWHQDATIAVRDRIDTPGFGPWAVKDGEHHCQPPRHVLESIVTIRVHLDACDARSGPLRVLAGSHTHGLLSDQAIAEAVQNTRIIDATCERGGIVLTTPLAVHSSQRATHPTRRRVLHLDCSNILLPSGLAFAEEA